jgi:DNA phosphorothioation-associated DGQHR protein 1
MTIYPLTAKALRVTQPLGVYYVTVLPAKVLLDVAFSDRVSAHLKQGDDVYELEGTQRAIQAERLQLITDYINRTDSAFPNSIILAANYRREDGRIEEEESDDPSENSHRQRRWSVSEQADGCHELLIPTGEKIAAIIDGQHRLFGYVKARPQRLEMNLICAVFLDLPKPFQAQLFATINSTQKPVPKSLTYELFGYNVEEEPEQFWSPDKLAVFITRKLGADPASPLQGRIIVAPEKDATLTRLTTGATWRISTAAVVEGIMRLFTSNPKKDTTDLLDKVKKVRTELATLRKDRSPLRGAYLASQDSVIYTLVLNYLRACEEVFWSKATPESFITRTVGIQALFDVLRRIAASAYETKDISMERFRTFLSPAGDIDFAAEQYRNASGTGRSLIRQAILDKTPAPVP